MNSRLPTSEEINVFDSLDEQCAVRHFLGKSLEQAQSLFRENFLYYQEDLMFMGPKGFCFYVTAAIGYLLSKESDGDCDAANTFCTLIEFRLTHERAEISASEPAIRKAILGMLADFERYHCDSNIYGDLPKRYRKLLAKLGGP